MLKTWQIREHQFALRLTAHVRGQAHLSGHIILPTGRAWASQFPVMAHQLTSPSFDSRLVREWLNHCDDVHGHNCGPPRRGVNGFSLRLRVIDLESWCIVSASPTCDYVALSYVWGSTEQQRLNEENFRAWTLPGAPASVSFPRTIRHAMNVCRELRLRYIWIDSLCIVQSSESDRIHQINNMHHIYSQAYLTIVVASGTDCDDGIPSIGPRKIPQKIVEIGGRKIATARWITKSDLLNSTWNSRAWTLQEYALSHRHLIFLPYQVAFAFKEGVRREHFEGYLESAPWFREDPQSDILPVLRSEHLALQYSDYVFDKFFIPLSIRSGPGERLFPTTSSELLRASSAF